VIIILGLLFLILIAIAIYAFLLRRDAKKSNEAADRAIKAAEAATAAAEASAAANRELYAVLLKQNQQLQSAGIAAEAIPTLPPSDDDGKPGPKGSSPNPVEGAQEWVATGDFISNTYYEHYGTKRTVENAGIQLSDVDLSMPSGAATTGAHSMPPRAQRGSDMPQANPGLGSRSAPQKTTNPQDHFMGS